MVIMKVKDLIKELEKIDQNIDIYGYTEDENLASKEKTGHVFSIDGVGEAFVEMKRNNKGQPTIKFGDYETKGARKIAIIDISTDF